MPSEELEIMIEKELEAFKDNILYELKDQLHSKYDCVMGYAGLQVIKNMKSIKDIRKLETTEFLELIDEYIKKEGNDKVYADYIKEQ